MDPFKYPNLTATYITNWVKGAKTVHNLNIDYVGVSTQELHMLIVNNFDVNTNTIIDLE